MHFVTGTYNDLGTHQLNRLARYRYQLFVETLGWELEAKNNLEFDQFDRPDTLYVIAKDTDERIVGTARLLPTTRSYLLSEVFPELLNGQEPPHSPDVWELSRFAAHDFHGMQVHSKGELRQVSSDLTVSLLKAAIDAARERGAKRLITVSPLGIERLLRQLDVRTSRAGRPVMVNGHRLFAAWIYCDD